MTDTLAPRTLVQVSPRGQLTLPTEVRTAVGIGPGDTLVVTVEEGRIVLQRAVVVPVETYDDARIEEFRAGGDLTAGQVAEVRRKWGLDAANSSSAGRGAAAAPAARAVRKRRS